MNYSTQRCRDAETRRNSEIFNEENSAFLHALRVAALKKYLGVGSAAGIRPGGRAGVGGERGLVGEGVIGVGVRLLKVVALHVIETEVPEHPEIIGRFDEFGVGLFVHGIGEIDDGLERSTGEDFGRLAANQRARYLEEIDRQFAQTVERAQVVAEDRKS